MIFYWLVLGVLATWRITHLIQAEDGPWDIMVRFRRMVGNGFWGKLFDCFECASMWVSIPLAWRLGDGALHRVLLWFSLSAGAILLERLTTRNTVVPAATIPTALYTEDLYTIDKE